jgi:ubiquitin C-terminal hydrolase
MGEKNNCFCENFLERINFDSDHHLKENKHAEKENETFINNHASRENQPKNIKETKMKSKHAKGNKNNDSVGVDKENIGMLQTKCIVLRFVNPAGKNLCFSNTAMSCILNIPSIKQLAENHKRNRKRYSIITEMSKLTKLHNFSTTSTEKIRSIVQHRCFEAGQWTKSFDDNKQHDTGEFLLSLFEHLWNEEEIPISFKEKLFGGLCQNTLKCTCGYNEELQVHPLPAVIPIQTIGENIQTCFESYFLSEEVDWECPKCPRSKVRKHSLLIAEPKVLILQLMRYNFDETD